MKLPVIFSSEFELKGLNIFTVNDVRNCVYFVGFTFK